MQNVHLRLGTKCLTDTNNCSLWWKQEQFVQAALQSEKQPRAFTWACNSSLICQHKTISHFPSLIAEGVGVVTHQESGACFF